MSDAIWDDFWKSWIAENGLAKLVGDEFYPPNFDGLGFRNVHNENGILFLAYFIMVSRVAGLSDKCRAKSSLIGTTIERLVRGPHRGLFDRIPIGTKESLRTPERHDNYVGIVALSKIFGFHFHREILSYGINRGFNYNNVEPDKWDGKSQRQGGDVCFYFIACDSTPEIINFIWFLIGVFINCYDGDPGRSNLTWLRLYTLDRSSMREWWVKIPLIFISEIWKISKWFRFTSLKNMMQGYFSDKHPITKMAGTIKDNEWGF